MTKTGSVSGKIRFPGSSFSGLFLQASCHVSQHSFWFAAVGDADSEDPDSQDGSSVSAGLLHHAGLCDRYWLLPVEGAGRLNMFSDCLTSPTLQWLSLFRECLYRCTILGSQRGRRNVRLSHFAEQ